MNDLRGSLWRKWDLHVHSPVSALYNHFQGTSEEEKWTNYLNKLRSITDIAVVGITDYFSVDGYKYVRDHGNISNIDLLLPNVELRILPVTTTETPINLHVIFNPAIVDELESKFFSSMEFSYQSQIYKCTRTDLIKLGRDYSDDESLADHLAYKEGVNQFKTNIDNLKKIFSKDKELRENAIIIVSNSNNDGNSGIQHSSLAATRQSIYWFSHCIFSANPNDFNYFLGKGVDNPQEIIRKYGNLKPCIHGSDAHDLERIGVPCTKRAEQGHICEPDSKDCNLRFCWIKADPTFEGLKQILYEPEERVKIQANSPFEDRRKIFFDSASLEGSVNFILPNFNLPLNRELVTIIGGRGSGKSAFLELFAFLNEEHVKKDQNGKEKLIEFYRQNIEHRVPSPDFLFKAKIIDKDNNTYSYSKKLTDYENMRLPFLYIGQEQLSSIATNDKELTEKVCELINLNFSELKYGQIIENARLALAQISILREEIFDIQGKYPEFKSESSKSAGFESWLKNYIAKKEQQKKTLSSQETKQLLGTISKQLDRSMKLSDYLSELSLVQSEMTNTQVNIQISQLNKLSKLLYKEATLQIPLIDFQLQNEAIRKQKSNITTEAEKLRKSIEENKKQLVALGIKEDITALVQAIESVQREITQATKDLILHKEKKNLLIKIVEERNTLYKSIKAYVESSKDEIDAKFKDFSESRHGTEENELFQNIISDVGIEGAIVFNEDLFCKFLLDNCLDKRKTKTIQDVKTIIAGKENGIAKEINLDVLCQWVENDLNSFLKGENFNDGGAQKLVDFLFLKWTTYVTVKAVAKLKQIPTDKLSVGQRGTLLLKIYLATASVKQIFIVDQPEDNLDNQFIMNQLVPLIRQIKKTRQIILSTHNANLVVNADAEQVIVAQLDQEQNKEYISGSIENSTINKKIKDILEGGEEAFRKRENKYGFGQM